MKSNRIADAISHIDEDLVLAAAGETAQNAMAKAEHAEDGSTVRTNGTVKEKTQKKRAWRIPAIGILEGIAATGLLAGLVIVAVIYGPRSEKRGAGKATEPVTPAEDEIIMYDIRIHSPGLKIGEYEAEYEQVNKQLAERMVGRLSENLGEPAFTPSTLEDGSEWFRLSGHEDLQYVISRKDGEYNMWQFSQFYRTDYPYQDVLELVYNVTASDDIKEITVKPSLADNTDEGKRLQEQIGIRKITDRNDIDRFYRILLKPCRVYGPSYFRGVGPEEIKAERYLEIVLEDGRKIDSLKYTAALGLFFEDGGITYTTLSEEDRGWMISVMGIEYDASGLQPTPSPTPLPVELGKPSSSMTS